MSERTEAIMDAIWEARNSGADTEEKLVSAILSIVAENVQFYNAQDGRIVLDKTDMLKLSEEFNELN